MVLQLQHSLPLYMYCIVHARTSITIQSLVPVTTTVIVMGTGTRDGTGDTAVPWYTSPYAQCVLTGIAIQVIVITIQYQ